MKRLEKEIPLYKGQTQRFSTDVLALVPAAIAHLGNLLDSLDAYTSLTAPAEVTSSAPEQLPEQNRRRHAAGSLDGPQAVDEEEAKEDEPPQPKDDQKE